MQILNMGRSHSLEYGNEKQKSKNSEATTNNENSTYFDNNKIQIIGNSTKNSFLTDSF